MKARSLLSIAGLFGAIVGSASLLDAAETAPKPAFFMHGVVDAAGPLFAWGKCAADVNGDGKMDLLVGGWRGGGLVWYENPGWTKHVIDPAAKISTDIEVADIDRDGKPDVIAVTSTGIVWYHNPDWKPHPVGKDTVHDFEVADFDGDGLLDIVARNQNLSRNASGATLFFYRQSGLDTWTRTTQTIPDGEGLKAADIDHDGDLDIVINGTWFENPGRLGVDWAAHVYGPDWKQDKVFVAVGDINGDGRLDIALSPSEPKGQRYHISWFEAPADPKSGQWSERIVEPDIETVQHFVGIADFNLDGQPDIATAAMLQGDAPQHVSIYLNRGKGAGWTKQIIGTTGNHSMRVVDLDGDGTPSLFGVNHQDCKVELWRNTTRHGKLSLDRWQRHVVDEKKPWKGVFITASDLDGDGRPDIVTGPSWYKNPGSAGGRWERKTFGEPLYNMAAVYDFDGDGRPDVLGTQYQGTLLSPEFVWARNEGQGTFTIHANIAHAVGDFLQGVAVDRFGPNGTGPLEVALSWHNGSGRGIQMLTLPEDPIGKPWTWRRISTFDQQEELTARDLDGDGLKDLVLGTRWLRNGKEGWTVMPLGDSTQQVDRHRDADINGDGRVDVVLGFLGIGVPAKLVWLEMPADPKSGHWIEHVIAEVVGPMSIDVADLDGDGDIDVVVGEHNLKEPAAARLLIFENLDGKGGKWQAHEVARGDEHHDGAQLVDIDGDGDLDIVSIGWGHPRVLLYENKALEPGGNAERK